ncbi:hypothetical protein [Polynucleobacter sp. UK-FUSCHL-C3]|uniref:Polysaccharide deacetylase n=1 Tax=Polynucleobacter sp. UK-FUSCHL-C3 TaxID=2955208 RepID=A0AAU8A2V4_9BURK
MTTEASRFYFTRDNYLALLKKLRESGYQFSTFSKEMDASPKNAFGQRCLLRHDIDISMDYALDMAILEREIGVCSTYFLMLRSPMYNLMSRHSTTVLRRLIDLGHDIGLHFDAGCLRRQGVTLENDIRFELDILSSLLGQHVKAFSFHQPNEKEISSRVEIPGVINTYHPDQLVGYKYISDSNRVWREMNPFEIAAHGFDRLHILIHPIWWMCEEAQTMDCWDRAIERNFHSSQQQLLETERAYGSTRSINISKGLVDEDSSR